MRTYIITLVVLLTLCQPTLAEQNDFSKPCFLRGDCTPLASPPSWYESWFKSAPKPLPSTFDRAFQPDCTTSDGKDGYRTWHGRAVGEQCDE